MALEFTKLSEVENIETPVAEATIIVEDSGSIKRTPMKNISGDKVLSENGKLLNEVLPEGYPYEEVKETVFLDTVVSGETIYNYSSIRILVNLGEEYDVIFDDVEYKMTASGVPHFARPTDGNVLIGTGFKSDNPSFCLSNYGLDVADTDEHSIIVKQVETTVVPMAEKFIPDNVAKIEDIPEEFSGSWNDLTDKPFGEEYSDTLTFNGFFKPDAPVLENTNNGTAYKISDVVPSEDDLVNCGIVVIDGRSYTLSDGFVSDNTYDGYLNIYDGACYVVYDSDKAGTSCGIYTSDSWPMTSLTIEGKALFRIVKTIDHKFLPDGYPYEEEGEVAITEVLEDPVGGSGFYLTKEQLLDGELPNTGDKVKFVINGVSCDFRYGYDEYIKADGEAIGTSYVRNDKLYVCIYEAGTVQIFKNGVIAHPMAEKFLPDDIVHVVEWENVQNKPFGEKETKISVTLSEYGDRNLIVENGDETTETPFETLHKESLISPYVYYKVLDFGVCADAVRTAKYNDQPIINEDTWNQMVEDGRVNDDFIQTDDSLIVIYKENAQIPDTSINKNPVTFEKIGTYIRLYYLENGVTEMTDITVKPIDSEFLPKAESVADAAGETVTGAEFNALLTSLRNAGLLKS